MVEATWEDFCDAGLMWWVNRILHPFGWVICREQERTEDGQFGEIRRVYPARTAFRGFAPETETDGFRRLYAHIQANINDPKSWVHIRPEGEDDG